MTYELAKQLKDAGYNGYLHFNGDGTVDYDLSELIEACGESFISLKFTPKDWSDWLATGAKNGSGFFEYASSPTRAVAKLWLKLNK